MTQNTETKSHLSLEKQGTRLSHISDAERLLISIEAGRSPDEELEALLKHADSYGDLDERVVADEVGGLAIAEYVTDTVALPLLLGEQQIDGIAIAFDEIEHARGEETLTYIVNRIETAEHSSEVVNSRKEQTNEHKEEQLAHVKEMLESYDTKALSEYLASPEEFSMESLREVIRLIGIDAFEANTWVLENEREEQLEKIATGLIKKSLLLPYSEQVGYLESIVGLDDKHYPRSSYIRDVLEQHPQHGQDIEAMLFEKKAYIHILQNLEPLGVDHKDFINILYQDGKPDIVLDNAHALIDSIDMDGLQEQLYSHGMADKILYHFHYFNNIYDQQRLAETLIKEDKIYTLVGYLSLFPEVDKTLIIKKCVESRNTYLLDDQDLLNALDPPSMEALLRQHHEYSIILSYPGLFPEADSNELVDLSFKAGRGYELMNKVRDKKFQVGTENLFEKVVLFDQAHLAFEFPEYFSDPQRTEVLEEVIKGGSVYAVMKYIEQNPIVTKATVIEMAIQYDQAHQLFYTQEYLKDVSMDELAETFLRHGKYGQLIEKKDEIFPLLSDKGARLAQILGRSLFDESNLSERDFGAINTYLSGVEDQSHTPEVLKLTNRYMTSEGATYAGFKIVSALHSGALVPAEAAELGVTKGGVKGLEQFGVICRGISEELMNSELSDATLEKVLNFELYAGIVQKLYRVDVTEFVATQDFSVRTVLEKHHKAYIEGNLAAMPSEYTIVHTELSTLQERSVGLTEDAIERYQILKKDILAAVDSLAEAHPFARHLEKIGVKIMKESERLVRDAKEMAEHDINDRASAFKLKNLQEKQSALNSLMIEAREGKYVGNDFVLRSPEDMSHVFGQLEKFDVLHSDLRQIIFAWALRKNPVLLDELKTLGDTPNVEELGTVRSFIEQIVNQETFGNYFTDKKLASRFKKLSSVKSIDEALVRHQKDTSSAKTVSFTLTPTRSAAMELSGHVGDACWAGKYESIAAEFPNITSVIMKRGEKGSSTERLVGSALLIETTDDAGNGVLLLRGINPIENFVNKVRIEEFYQTMTNYCRDIAAKRGLSPAVVIDTMSGASGTNRPVVHEYQERMKDKMKQVTVDAASSNFNGYDVSNKSYAL